MSSMRAVVEMGPACEWVELHAASPDEVVEAVLEAAARWCRPEDDERDELDVPVRERLKWIAESDHLVICGGVRVVDATGAAVVPGCCCELNYWREWADPGLRGSMWLGHRPLPRVEEFEGGIRVYQDSVMEQGQPAVIPAGELPRLLGEMQRDLIGFLGAVERAVERTEPELARAVVENLDRHLKISATLDVG